MSDRKFKKLSPGDTIGLVALSGPVNPDALSKAKQIALARGFKLAEPFDSSLNYGKTTHLFSAESPKVRAQALQQLFLDKQVSAIFVARGAYGSAEILSELDFKLIAQNPKPLIGFSDATAVLLAVNKLSGFLTIHGPTFLSAFGSEDQAAQLSTDFLFKYLAGETAIFESLELKSLRSGPAQSQGRVLAGNLMSLQSLLGTPWEPDFRDAILFFEETAEKPYRLHRVLLQMKQLGALAKLAGIVIGELKDCVHGSGKGPVATEAILDAAKGTDFPIWQADWFGHGAKNLPIPIGAQVILKGGHLRFAC